MGVTPLEMRALCWYVKKGWHRNVHWPIGGTPAALEEGTNEITSTPSVEESGATVYSSHTGTLGTGSSEDNQIGTGVTADPSPLFVPKYEPDKCRKCAKSMDLTQSHLHVEVGMSRIVLGREFLSGTMNVANFCQNCWGLPEQAEVMYCPVGVGFFDPEEDSSRSMVKREKQRFVHWDSKGPISSSIRVEVIDHFDARGKRRVYGRSDQFGRLVLYMDVWRSRDGRLFVRFWSRNQEVDWCSYEIVGLLDSESHGDTSPSGFCENWIPECLREEYDSWVISY